MYLTCLEKLGQTASINDAVKKRDELLVVSTVTKLENLDAPQQSPPQSTPLPDSTVNEPSTIPPAPTPSQVIADQVLSKSVHETSSSRAPIMDSLKPSSNSSQNAPIQVTIVERKDTTSLLTSN